MLFTSAAEDLSPYVLF